MQEISDDLVTVLDELKLVYWIFLFHIKVNLLDSFIPY